MGGGRGQHKGPPVPVPKARGPARLQAPSLPGPGNYIFFGLPVRSLFFLSFPSVLFVFSSCRPGWMLAIYPAALERGRADSRSRSGRRRGPCGCQAVPLPGGAAGIRLHREALPGPASCDLAVIKWLS